jgi:hypothetical protein
MMTYSTSVHASSTRLLSTAAIVAAGFAGVGVAIGVHDGHDSWLVPAITGVVVAGTLGAVWHVLISSAGRVRSLLGTTAVLGIGGIVTGLTIGASAQAIATMISGDTAVSAMLGDTVDGYARTLDEAHQDATIFKPLILTANKAVAGYRGFAKGEALSGMGPKYEEYTSFADDFQRASAALSTTLNEAEALKASGAVAISAMREAAAASDQDAFVAATVALGAAVSGLNGIDVSPIINGTGVVTVDTSEGVNLDTQTEDFQNEARAILADRAQVGMPAFTPVTKGEAVRATAFGASLHGWIVAAVIDLIPMLVLLFSFATAREVLLRESVPAKPYRAPHDWGRFFRRASAQERADRVRAEEDAVQTAGTRPRIVAGE